MGASESRPRLDDSTEAPKQGYHVVRVAAGSPAHLAGIEPFFDFCVGIDGVTLDPTKDVDGVAGSAGLGAWKSLEEREGTQVILNLWNSKRQELREVPIVPSRTWSVESGSDDPTRSSPSGTSPAHPSLLGLSLRLCNPSQALGHVWHVLEILEGSPAESAGLVPFGDFVIGWTGGVLKSEGDFYELVEAHVDRALRLYVYNSDYDHTREVIIVPNREWGGEGLLGCGVGYGLLHRIPKPQDHPSVPTELYPNGDQNPPASMDSNGHNLANPDHSQDYTLDEAQDEEDEYNTSNAGVTVSVRRDEDEEDDDDL